MSYIFWRRRISWRVCVHMRLWEREGERLDRQYLILFLVWNVLLKHNRPVHRSVHDHWRLSLVLHHPWSFTHMQKLSLLEKQIFWDSTTTHTVKHTHNVAVCLSQWWWEIFLPEMKQNLVPCFYKLKSFTEHELLSLNLNLHFSSGDTSAINYIVVIHVEQLRTHY